MNAINHDINHINADNDNDNDNDKIKKSTSTDSLNRTNT